MKSTSERAKRRYPAHKVPEKNGENHEEKNNKMLKQSKFSILEDKMIDSNSRI